MLLVGTQRQTHLVMCVCIIHMWETAACAHTEAQRQTHLSMYMHLMRTWKGILT